MQSALSDATSRERHLLPAWWQDLQSPHAYPEPTKAVSVRETHISWVFLLDRHVYKIRKPVRFSFVDFSTLERRLDDCRRELRLNRRLAPDIYLDVVPLVQQPDGHYRFGVSGQPIEYAVRMVRLPEQLCLEQVLRRTSITPYQQEGLIRVLAGFYQRLPPVTLATEAYCQRIAGHIADNENDLVPRVSPGTRTLVQRVLQSQRLFLHVFQHELDTRVQDGRIIEGHGDLRPEHIYLTDPPIVIDAVEFSRELRELDVWDELAFLAMECDRLGHRYLGCQLREAMRHRLADPASDRLWNFYKIYRATVRAKVAALTAEQLDGRAQATLRAQVRDYLLLAEQYLEKVAPPLLLVIGGISGSGKSTLARHLASRLGIAHLSTDQLRQQLLTEQQLPADRQYRYSTQYRDRVYEELFERADQQLKEGLSVVLDGTFLERRWRDRAWELAGARRALVCFFVCRCPAGICQERIRARTGDPSEAVPELVDRQLELQQHAALDPSITWVDTTESLPVQVQTVFDALRSRLSRPPDQTPVHGALSQTDSR
ncbi:MAG: hypothetical protein KatS3mg110_2739 [Pirellulaceae bacterium]|nr:MAG: hypothetical protein KatS3mg110_2739 [Pirellulaceae bacterium]